MAASMDKDAGIIWRVKELTTTALSHDAKPRALTLVVEREIEGYSLIERC